MLNKAIVGLVCWLFTALACASAQEKVDKAADALAKAEAMRSAACEQLKSLPADLPGVSKAMKGCDPSVSALEALPIFEEARAEIEKAMKLAK
jgi:hypothetical protein